jgi:antitoxin (DNA-binding transcriptional repressor) of toxin-antitoxin stability system
MFMYNLSPLEEVSTDWMRANLRHVFDQVHFYEARFAVLRRGQPVAGLVPIAEARALVEATRVDRRYRDVHRQIQIDDEDRLRQALSDGSGTSNGIGARPSG